MPKLSALVLPPLTDPDLPQLHRAAASARLRVVVNDVSRLMERPAIELHTLTADCGLLRAFDTAAEALEWLQPQGDAK